MSRVLRSDRKPLPPIHSENGIVFTDEEKAEAFALSMSRQCSLNLTNADLEHVEEIEDHVESIATEDPDEPTTSQKLTVRHWQYTQMTQRFSTRHYVHRSTKN
nr:PREDICTED: uncharacterized protein LOC107398821 [Tribolium castaneum]|eukprot:XP_015839724.1 PREDICTED: uncharacterized protein LOC107398821 [Tribolium castaneum]